MCVRDATITGGWGLEDIKKFVVKKDVKKFVEYVGRKKIELMKNVVTVIST